MDEKGQLPVEIRKKKRQFLIKEKDIIMFDSGKKPDERTIPEIIEGGLILLDKPAGPTSHQVSSWVRDILKVKKTGHCGTLDPQVTGVLPVAVGRATRIVDALKDAGKEYVGIIHLHRDCSEKRIRKVFEDFTGDIYQFPPRKSAVKRRLRIRTIYYLNLLEIKGRDILIRVGCQGGTYIRTLAVDIGDALGVGGQLKALRRTKVGPFDEENIHTLHSLKDGWEIYEGSGNGTLLREILNPLEKMVGGLPRVIAKDTAVDAVCHGADLAVTGILQVQKDLNSGERVAIMSRKGEIIGLGKSTLSANAVLEAGNGIAVVTKKVIMKKYTYPSMWKHK